MSGKTIGIAIMAFILTGITIIVLLDKIGLKDQEWLWMAYLGVVLLLVISWSIANYLESRKNVIAGSEIIKNSESENVMENKNEKSPVLTNIIFGAISWAAVDIIGIENIFIRIFTSLAIYTVFFVTWNRLQRRKVVKQKF